MSRPTAVTTLQKSQPRSTGHGSSRQLSRVARVSWIPCRQTSSFTLIPPEIGRPPSSVERRRRKLFALEDPQVVRQALRRDLGPRVADALHPAPVDQRHPTL